MFNFEKRVNGAVLFLSAVVRLYSSCWQALESHLTLRNNMCISPKCTEPVPLNQTWWRQLFPSPPAPLGECRRRCPFLPHAACLFVFLYGWMDVFIWERKNLVLYLCCFHFPLTFTDRFFSGWMFFFAATFLRQKKIIKHLKSRLLWNGFSSVSLGLCEPITFFFFFLRAASVDVFVPWLDGDLPEDITKNKLLFQVPENIRCGRKWPHTNKNSYDIVTLVPQVKVEPSTGLCGSSGWSLENEQLAVTTHLLPDPSYNSGNIGTCSRPGREGSCPTCLKKA